MVHERNFFKSSNIEQSFSSLRELIIISKMLDYVDKPLYSYIIEQKPATLESLVNSSVKFCKLAREFLLLNLKLPHLTLLPLNFLSNQINNSSHNNNFLNNLFVRTTNLRRTRIKTNVCKINKRFKMPPQTHKLKRNHNFHKIRIFTIQISKIKIFIIQIFQN